MNALGALKTGRPCKDLILRPRGAQAASTAQPRPESSRARETRRSTWTHERVSKKPPARARLADLRDRHLQERGSLHRQVSLEPRGPERDRRCRLRARPTAPSRSLRIIRAAVFLSGSSIRPWLGYASQKQFALDQAREPWILSVDADEWLDDGLRAALPRLIAADEAIAGWELRRTLTLYGSIKPRACGLGPSTSFVSCDGAAVISTRPCSFTRV